MYNDRLSLYSEVEAMRGHPLVVYVTSSRQGSNGLIAADSVPELLLQLDALPKVTKALDLLVVSNGGDPTVAWRIVSLIRERVSQLTVFVPQAAYSAATLIALGADSIVMHPHGNLGPTDPQIRGPRRGKDNGQDSVAFGSEDLSAFIRFAKEQVGLTDQGHLLSAFNHFCEEVGSVAVGVAARSAQLSVSMGEKLLQLHMQGDGNQKARAISEALNRDFFHHGYPVSRTEATTIGLPIAERNAALEDLIWRIWLDINTELQTRTPFTPIGVLRSNPRCSGLFAPVPQGVVVPQGIPPQAAQQQVQQALQQIQLVQVPPAPYENVHALMESVRLATRFVTEGEIHGTRQADGQIRMADVKYHQGWKTLDVPQSSGTEVARQSAPRKRVPSKRRAS